VQFIAPPKQKLRNLRGELLSDLDSSTFRRYALFALFLLLFLGCGRVVPFTPSSQRVEEVEKMLQSLKPTPEPKEVARLTHDLFRETAHLTKAFNLTSPPWFHNILVNTGIRQKGLCYHWSDTLYLYLKKQHYQGFSFHLAGANIGSCLKEHNALVITSRVGSFKEGVVVDPWRNSGELFLSPLAQDPSYTWVHRPKRELKR
jgi:hypothetical protein